MAILKSVQTSSTFLSLELVQKSFFFSVMKALKPVQFAFLKRGNCLLISGITFTSTVLILWSAVPGETVTSFTRVGKGQGHCHHGGLSNHLYKAKIVKEGNKVFVTGGKTGP